MPKTKTKKKRIPNFFTWTVKLQVHRSWVADGFDLDDDRALSMLNDTLPYAYGHEIKARVLTKPDKSLIRREQGYDE